ncbi:MAG: hypothetical protein MZV49_09630 [Rhodopseudomonas palustris]|nr:hypothetical protein [Rhodopseudomonas palustris]
MILQTKRTVNFPVFNSTEEMVRAMAMQMKFHENRAKPAFRTEMPEGVRLPKARAWMKGRSGDLGEETLELLGTFGVPVVKSLVAEDADQAAASCPQAGVPGGHEGGLS